MSVYAYFKNKIHLLPFEQSDRLPSRNGNLDIALGLPKAEAVLSIVYCQNDPERHQAHTLQGNARKVPSQKGALTAGRERQVTSSTPNVSSLEGFEDPPSL